MQFRNLKAQYQALKPQIDRAISEVLTDAAFISGQQVHKLEQLLAEYVGVRHCITCANGTDALEIALKALGVTQKDAVFVPDFTFFASAEAPASLGAVPVFVDIDRKTYNISPESLENAILEVLREGIYTPKAIVSVNLFGLTADYQKIQKIADNYQLKILEDGAQSFGAEYFGKRSCSFGDISTTSFFPAKPLGCYGDGGAIFTDDDDYAAWIRSVCVHGKGSDKYHNIRIGKNSRLDTLQAAILIEKFKAFTEYELDAVNRAAFFYSENLTSAVQCPKIPDGCLSSWAQYTIYTKNAEERDALREYLRSFAIPVNIYYPIPLHQQEAFRNAVRRYDTGTAEDACQRVLSLPIGPYLRIEEAGFICEKINRFY